MNRPYVLTAAQKRARYIAHSLEMRDSPAWRLLPDLGRRILDTLEVENAYWSGRKNGELCVTYDQFQSVGIRRSSINLGILQCVALGFLEKTRQGYLARDGAKVPNLFRLTYVKVPKGVPPPTDDWKKFRTEAEARDALKAVMAELDDDRRAKRENRKKRAADQGA